MTSLKSSYSLIFLLLITLSIWGQQATSMPDAELLRKATDRGFPGIILAVQKRDGELQTAAAGYSDLEHKKKMKTDERFHIASVTKIFTATAVLMLVDDGKLAMSTKVTDVLEEKLVGKIPHIRQITIAQLLDHSSGIYGFNNDPEYIAVWLGSKYDRTKTWSAKELIGFADGSRSKPFGDPGSGHYYSDTNYVLLRLILEKRSGTTLRQFVDRRILEPLSMKNTGYYSTTNDGERVTKALTVQGYLKRSDTIDSVVTLDKSFKAFDDSLVNTTNAVERLDGPSGMVSTAGDLVSFGRALYSGRLLKKKSMNWLFSVGTGMEWESVGSSRQGVVKAYREYYGVLFASAGDGPAGINVTLAYHPKSDTVLVGFTNIFGLFDEGDFMREKIFSDLICITP